MNCNEARENLIELMTTEVLAGSAVAAHVRECSACAQKLESLRKTMALMDEWEVPEPSPYFLTRLAAHVREEREKAPVRSGVFSWIRRPVTALSLAAVLAAGALIYINSGVVIEGPRVSDTGAAADVEALDRNHEVLVNTDLIDELSGGPSDDVTDE